MKKFRTEVQIYNEPGVIESNCNDISFENKGTNPAVVNGYTLYFGDTFKPTDPQPGEEDVTNYILSFSGLGSNILVVTRKRYQ